jgi:hypothetical protein
MYSWSYEYAGSLFCVHLSVCSSSLLKDLLEAPGSIPLYLCFPPAWDAAGCDQLRLQNSWDCHGNDKFNREISPQDLNEKRDLPRSRFLCEKLKEFGRYGHHQGVLMRPINPLLRLQPNGGMDHWSETYLL